ncbi:MAG: hypothetical protein H0U49_09210 [Parachlamydiaceae bacterium]|nr:hypothetical protein [Parachlamydiaceae bacterium]
MPKFAFTSVALRSLCISCVFAAKLVVALSRNTASPINSLALRPLTLISDACWYANCILYLG